MGILGGVHCITLLHRGMAGSQGGAFASPKWLLVALDRLWTASSVPLNPWPRPKPLQNKPLFGVCLWLMLVSVQGVSLHLETRTGNWVAGLQAGKLVVAGWFT